MGNGNRVRRVISNYHAVVKTVRRWLASQLRFHCSFRVNMTLRARVSLGKVA